MKFFFTWSVIVFICFLFFILSIASDVSAKYGSMSMYHFSGTTFLNLRKMSQPFAIELQFDKIIRASADDEIFIESIKEFLKPKIVVRGNIKKSLTFSSSSSSSSSNEKEEEFLFKDTLLGDVVVRLSGYLKTGFLRPPNGEHSKQGWIVNESDYLPEEILKGDLAIVEELFHFLDEYPVLQKSLKIHVKVDSNDPMLLRNLMVNFYRPENRKDMVLENSIQLQHPYTPGFLQRLLQLTTPDDINNTNSSGVSTKRIITPLILTYNPTMEQLYEDFIIRQTADRLLFGTGIMDTCWTMNKYKATKIILQNINNLTEETTTIDFDYGFDISPILLAQFPNKTLTKKLLSLPNNKFQVGNFVTFNEHLGTNIGMAIKRSVGFVKVTELYGPIVADSAVAQISYVQKSVIKDIRKRLLDSKQRDMQIIVKYIVWDAETCPHYHRRADTEIRNIYKKKENVILGYIETNVHGLSPLVIPSANSIVHHQRTEHRFNILGKLNPALINFNVAHALENKYWEFLFWETYAPGFLADTKLLYHIVGKKKNITMDEFQHTMTREFPHGFILKGVWDYNSYETILHYKLNLQNLLEIYKNSSSYFDAVVETQRKILLGCEPIEDLNSRIQNMLPFRGWKISNFLSDTTTAIVQRYHEIKRENRVECISGHCPIKMMNEDDDRSSKDSKRQIQYYFEIINAAFLSKGFNKLPDGLRGTPFTADVAIVNEKPKNINQNNDIMTDTITFETNPGGNSWLIHHDIATAKEHHKLLRNLLTLDDERSNRPILLQKGLTPIYQIAFLKRIFNIELTLKEEAPRFTFLRDRIVDKENVFPKKIKYERINSTRRDPLAPKIVYEPQRLAACARGLKFIQKNLWKLTKNSQDFIHTMATLAKIRYSFSEKMNMTFTSMVTEMNTDGRFIETLLSPLFLTFENSTLTNFTLDYSSFKWILLKAEEIADWKTLEPLFLPSPSSKFISNITEKYHHLFHHLLQDTKYIEWKQKLLKDLFDTEEFRKYLSILVDKSADNSHEIALSYFDSWLSNFTQQIIAFQNLDHLGYRLPDITIEILKDDWIIQVRKLYWPISHLYALSTTASSNTRSLTLNNKSLVRSCYVKLFDVMTVLLKTQTSSSSDLFGEELQFLKNSTNHVKVGETIVSTDELFWSILHATLGLNHAHRRNPSLRLFIQNAQFAIVYSQEDDGSWKTTSVYHQLVGGKNESWSSIRAIEKAILSIIP